MKLHRVILIILLSSVCIKRVFSQDYGNTSGQEYGDPVYRKLITTGVPDYNHTGIYSGINSSHYDRVRQALGTGYTTHETYFSTEFSNHGTDYYGAYTLNNMSMIFYYRRAVVSTAISLVNASIEYPSQPPSCIIWYGTTFDGSIYDIANIRCDGFVEYCYEYNGLRVWRNQDYIESNWSIVYYPSTHNDLPDLTRNPDSEASPWAQRGAPCGTGPSFLGCDYDPPDTKMNRSAVVNLPTYQFSAEYGNGYTDITVKATDESGIHYIGYMKPGDTVWSYSPTQTQDPYYDNYSFTFRVNQSGYFYAYAIDNGGNYPSSVSPYWIDVQTAPPIPTLISPVNNSTGVDTNPTLTWNASSGATSYGLQVYSASLGEYIVDESGITGTSYELNNLENNSIYLWRVSASNNYLTSSFSPLFKFTSKVAAPTAPELLSPPQNSVDIDIEPTLDWSSTTGAEFYQLHVFEIIESSPFLFLSYDEYSNTRIKLPTLKHYSQYMWKVSAGNEGGYSPFSEEFYFTTIKDTDIEELDSKIPTEYYLAQNYPNPFNPATTIEFSIVERTHVLLSIFNTLGQEIEKLVDQNLTPGNYSVNWIPGNIPSGAYFYTIKTSNFIDTKRLYLLK